MALINCENASFSYDGTSVISNTNFQINEGDYICIVGENGSGKSTLMKGLLKLKDPSEGIISYGDGLKPKEIGYLPQQSEHQKDFPASILEVVLSGRLNALGFKPFYSRKDKIQAMEQLSMVNMHTLANHSYQELSGGQRQRVLLARALCATKKLLLLDEPVAGLDPIATQDLYAKIKEINQSGITIVMVTHDIRSCLDFATHILHMGNKQLFFGSKEIYVNTSFGKNFINRAGGEKHESIHHC